MTTIQLPPDFREFLKSLNKHEAKYLMIGGYAVAYHGYPRATADMDIWVSTSPQNAKKIVAAVKEFGFDPPNLTSNLFTKEGQIVRMGNPPLRIEIFTSVSGLSFDECYSARNVESIAGIEVHFINLDHLKINKKATGRHKDYDDLENLP